MPRQTKTEVISRKLKALNTVFIRLKREERLFKRRNRKLAKDIQRHKEWIKELDEEKIDLTQQLFTQQYAKAICDEDLVTLSGGLSSVLKEVHNLQTKIMGCCVDNLVANNGRQTLSRTLVAMLKESAGKDETMRKNQPELVIPNINSVSRDESYACGESSLPSTNKEMFCAAETKSTNQPDLKVPNVSHDESYACGESSGKPLTNKEMFCMAETMGTNQLYLKVPNVISSDESYPCGESSLSPINKELFCMAETMSTNQPDLKVPNTVSSDESGACGESSSPQINKEMFCATETMSTNQPDLKVPNIVSSDESGACGESSSPQINKKSSGCSSSFYRRETVLLDSNSCTENNQQIDIVNSSSDESFIGFTDDPIIKAKFMISFTLDLVDNGQEQIEKLSLTYSSIGSLRDNQSALSLTVCETRPEAENTGCSALESEWSKQFNLQRLEVSLPRVYIEPSKTMSSSTMSLIWHEQDKAAEIFASKCNERGNPRQSLISSNKPTSSHQIGSMEKTKVSEKRQKTPKTPISHSRDDLPGSTSDSLSNGRVPRRARKAVVSYKEKSVNVKMRR